MAVEIRDYCGDFADAVELIHRVWRADYSGRMWFPLWDADFLNWQVGHHRRWCVAGYDRRKIVACVFSVPHTLQIRSTIVPITFSSWFTVDPDYRRTQVGSRLIAELERRHHDARMGLSLGVVSGYEDSNAYRYWSRYARKFPENCRFLFRAGFWAKVLNPTAVARASVKWWERAQTRLLGAALRQTPCPSLESMRPYSPDDLPACVQLLERAGAGLDWTIRWAPERLRLQLEGSVARTLVYEQHGTLGALVNYHRLRLQGHVPIRAAWIDLCATSGTGTMMPARVLATVCAHLVEEAVDVVLCPRSAAFSSRALLANAFTPLPRTDHVVAFFQRPDVPLERPKTWNILFR
jgi:GNAT superfamily N-acetyltransferase